MPFYTLPSRLCVDEAARLISHKVIRTPVITSQSLSSKATAVLQKHCAESSTRLEIFFKCENFQQSGSFKFRGASHFISRLEDHELRNGVVAYSTGNHAQAVALAAQNASTARGFAIPAFLAVPHDCPPKKIDATRGHGGTVFLSGLEPESRLTLARKIHESTGAVIVPPADHVDIVLGQATAVSEFVDQVQDIDNALLDAVVVPSGGGGLLVGAVAACRPMGVVVFGAEPAHGGPGLANGLRTGRRTNRLEQKRTMADGLRTLTGEANWEHVKSRENVDQVFAVSEDDIRQAMRLLVDQLGFVIEPSAVVSLAVVLFSKEFHQRVGRMRGVVRIGVILTGGNIDTEQLQALLPGIEIK
ncbi:pyridoxal-5'-phosphate-dependent enzyme [Lentithecium fluviatile CBS 122367]|uniref:Pyridoxal-5'-phosphate-dependent enzyme n=1 Tax=Lentithecium fluviatile CBS 122367 TaxID=1168545 RepID=A0A6G1J889_9PLEO|nr:pyridoxal-5'-phosphate-dependent enzyme [Lentithecium fluviatile CBS 122367]